jgi:hypothetical protein
VTRIIFSLTGGARGLKLVAAFRICRFDHKQCALSQADRRLIITLGRVTAAWQVAENWLIFEFIAVTFLWPLLQLDVAFVESITAHKNRIISRQNFYFEKRA